MEEDIEVLEINEEKEMEEVLNQESHSRDTMLKMANQALEKQSINMITYAKLTEKMQKIQESYLLLKEEKESLEKHNNKWKMNWLLYDWKRSKIKRSEVRFSCYCRFF